MSLGPVMMDLAGVTLTPIEREQLRHPLVGGVILFARNFTDSAQLRMLTAEIHALRQPPLIIAVDHEGGRVQRFRAGFTPLPPCGAMGALYAKDRGAACLLARSAGFVMAAELLEAGVDISFAPVLDLDRGHSAVIGNRAFDQDPEIVTELAGQYIAGMAGAGMAATGKHFPGHGGVAGDSHTELPVDDRLFIAIEHTDLVPFAHLAGELAGIMPAHVQYPQVAPEPAGFSPFWLQEILRKRLQFEGVIFSDDLNMAGARGAGNLVARAQAALAAGCDMVLACNDPAGLPELLDGLAGYVMPTKTPARLARLHGQAAWGDGPLQTLHEYTEASRLLRHWYTETDDETIC
ncbi:MAG: beta-N-acetylhexosaminidase [Gammaproteobacteria bacterium]|nr:beta-N-acetylhexosaminidase [Gammaproteobacteria bacterium]